MNARWIICCLLTGGLTCSAVAQVIAPDDTTEHVGQTVLVEGVLFDIGTSRAGHLYLNFGDAYPRHVFSIFIHRTNARAFPDLNAWKGKQVTVRGQVQLREGKPQIAVRHPRDLWLSGSEPFETSPHIEEDAVTEKEG